MPDERLEVILTYGPVHTQIHLPDPFLMRDLFNYMTVENPDYYPGDDEEEKVVEFFCPEESRVITGLAPVVARWAHQNDLKVTIEGWPYDPKEGDPAKEVPADLISGITLRPYQQEAIQKSVQHWRGVLEIATGGGKTEVAIGLYLTLHGPRTLYIVPSQASMHEMFQRFQERGVEDVGRLGDGFEEVDKQVVIAVVNSVYSGIKRSDWEIMQLLEECELLFEDECHHKATAFTWKVVAANCKADRRIGLSGTPYKDDKSRFNPFHMHHLDSWLTGYIGDTLLYLSPRELQERGSLALCKIISFPTGGYCPDTSDWHTVYEQGIVRNEARNNQIGLIVANLVDLGRYPIISVERLDHGRDFQRKFASIGIIAACMFGDGALYVPRAFAEAEDIEFEPAPLFEWQETTNRRGEKVRKKVVVGHEDDFVQIPTSTDVRPYFQERKIHCLIGSRPFDEFLNVTFLTDLVNAAGYKAHQRFRQKIGRTLRLHAGKTVAWIWEPWDNCHYYLRRHSQKRLKVAQKEGFPVEADWTFSYPFYAHRFCDFRGGIVNVRRKEIEVRVDMRIPVGVQQPGVFIQPSIRLVAELEDGDDVQECADRLHCEAAALFYRESYRQAQIAGNVCTAGFQEECAKYLNSFNQEDKKE